MDELNQAFENLLIIAKKQFGPAEFKYRRVHHAYRNKSHWVSCKEHPEVTREEYLEGLAESKNKSSKAFYGELKCSYDEYRQEISKRGYLQEIESMIKVAIKKEMLEPEESEEAQKQQATQKG